MKPEGRYRKGAWRERMFVASCISQGAIWAGRIAGSRGIIDVVAVYPTMVMLSQLKCGSAKLSPEEGERLTELARHCPPRTFVSLVEWADRGKPRITEFPVKE